MPRDLAPIQQWHHLDDDGNPAGGYTEATGLTIHWQNGPITDEQARNGAFVEDVIDAAIGRIEHYQATKFHCIENAAALGHLKAAAEILKERTRGRADRGVEGTHQL